MAIEGENHGGSTITENLLAPQLASSSKTPTRKAIRKTFKKTAILARLLPTGSVLTFQILSPIFTNEGQCHAITSRYLTLSLLTLCGVSCFLLCLTDSFRDGMGKIRHGIATLKGLWIIDGSVELSKEEAEKYRLKLIDICHAFMSMLVFGAVALFDKNVVKCLYPAPTEEVKELLVVVPAGIGVICSILFLAFPTKRHGIGSPLSKK